MNEFAYSSEEYVPKSVFSYDEIELNMLKECIVKYDKSTLIDAFSRKKHNGNNELVYISKYKKETLYDISSYENDVLLQHKIARNDFFRIVDVFMYSYPNIFLIIAIEIDKLNAKLKTNIASLSYEYFSSFKNYDEIPLVHDNSVFVNMCKNRHLISQILSLDAFSTILQGKSKSEYYTKK